MVKSKKLAVFLDGTWNSVEDNTNVWRLKALCQTASSEGAPQLVYYEIGVNGVAGGMVGKGLSENVREAYEWLIDNYNEGDEIFIFGFSRGAYTASRPLKKGPASASFRFARYFQDMSEPVYMAWRRGARWPLVLLPHVAASSFGSRTRL